MPTMTEEFTDWDRETILLALRNDADEYVRLAKGADDRGDTETASSWRSLAQRVEDLRKRVDDGIAR